MQLDSIIYDIDSLKTAITEQLVNDSAAFNSIYPSDTATSLVHTLASYSSMLQYQFVSAMANCYTETAYSEAGIRQLAETLGNRLHGNISSQVYCNITRTNLLGKDKIIIPAGSEFTVESLTFFNPDPVIFTTQSNVVSNVKLIQGKQLTSEQLTSGISGEKLYFCENFKCNTDLVEVYVNNEQWDIVDSFLPYVITDTSIAASAKVVRLKTDPDGRTYIKFGNNTNGIVPAAGTLVTIKYISNEGASGNLDNNDLTINLTTPLFYTSENNTTEQLTTEIYAVTTASGGFNTQSLEVLKESSPYVFGSGQRAVRRDDYKSMLLNKCGYLTTNVWGEYEEASLVGSYDKIMMNMVYYSGVKAFQKYDLQPIETIYVSMTQLNNNRDLQFYTISNNIKSARGFLGSYLIDISSYNTDNLPVTVKYRDNSGNGILTCDPSVNSDLANFETDIFSLNDFAKLVLNTNVTLRCNQYNPGTADTALSLLQTGSVETSGVLHEYQSSGKDPVTTLTTVITYNNPYQLFFEFSERKAVAAFQFQAPFNDLRSKYFINQFAIFATNEENTDDTNIKNNSQWVRLLDTQTFDDTLSLNEWSDWITTNVYAAGVEETADEDLSSQCASTAINVFNLTSDKIKNKDFKFTVTINGAIQPSNSYAVDTSAWTVTFTAPVAAGSIVSIAGTAVDWITYKRYVIEIYSVQDTSILNPDHVCLGKIKFLFKDSVSTINYSDNNAINLKIPIQNSKDLIEAYTIPSSTLQSNNWLSATPGGAALTPDVFHNYFIHDDSTYTYTPTVGTPGTGYALNDSVSITAHTDTTSSINYPLSLTVTDVDATGQIVDAVITNNKGTVALKAEVLNVTGGTGSGATISLGCVKTNDWNNKTVRFNTEVTPNKYTEIIANTRRLELPEDMQYYEYKVATEGINETNGYKTGDELTYSVVTDNYNYTFTLTVLNIAQATRSTNGIRITLTIDKAYPTTILRGKSGLTVNGLALNGGSGSGATISITSNSTLNVYGSYTGNFYTNTDIQALDLPTINKYNHFTTYLEFKQPHIKNIAINVQIEYENVTNYQVVKNNVINAINNLFALTPYYIGTSLDISNIWKAINEVAGVKRFMVLAPTRNIDCKPYEIIALPAENLIIQDILTNEYK